MKQLISSFVLSLVLVMPVAAQTGPNLQGPRGGIGASSTIFEERKQAIRDRFETKKEERETRREELKEKLSTFKDEKRAQLAERISDNLNKLNEKLTAKATEHIAKMIDILARIESRDTTGEAADEIATAEAAINAAETAVDIQAGKIYSLTITDEASVGSAVSAARAQLKGDLEVMFAAIKDAREAVRNAHKAIVKTNVASSTASSSESTE